MPSQHILIIGLDGATWDLLQPWLDNKQLPYLASLRKQEVWGNLRSTIPPITGPAWVSFATDADDYYYPDSLEPLLKETNYQIDLDVEKEGFIPGYAG
ncbi:alkaline phosphatase family protein [Patescibacteria group bacterium]|nr:alkaline phosphatase family protein [Patescibacteria group bacterium]